MVFTIDDIKTDIGKIEAEILSTTYGLKQPPLNKFANDILRDINFEGYFQGHANYNKLYDEGWKGYLLDVVNTDEGKKGDDALKSEYENFQKGSFYNAFAIVVSEYVYKELDRLQKEKTTDWEKDSNKIWEAYNKIRSNINNASASNTYGDNTSKDADENAKLKSWYLGYEKAGDKNKGKFEAFDYKINLKDAVAQMKKWGEVKAVVFNLDTAKNELKANWDKPIKELFKDAGIDDFKDKLKVKGSDAGKWNNEADYINKKIDTCGDENAINTLKADINEQIASLYINLQIEEASKTKDINLKKGFLKKITDFQTKYKDASFQKAFNDGTNKGNIDALKKETGTTTLAGFPYGGGFVGMGGTGGLWYGQRTYDAMPKDNKISGDSGELNPLQQKAQENNKKGD